MDPLDEFDEFNEPMLGTDVMRFAPSRVRQHYDDQALEYSIRSEPAAASGLIVYGRYQRGWVCNPTLRPVVAELLGRLGIQL